MRHNITEPKKLKRVFIVAYIFKKVNRV